NRPNASSPTQPTAATRTPSLARSIAAFDAQPPMFSSRWSVITSSPAFGQCEMGAHKWSATNSPTLRHSMLISLLDQRDESLIRRIGERKDEGGGMKDETEGTSLGRRSQPPRLRFRADRPAARLSCPSPAGLCRPQMRRERLQ